MLFMTPVIADEKHKKKHAQNTIIEHPETHTKYL